MVNNAPKFFPRSVGSGVFLCLFLASPITASASHSGAGFLAMEPDAGPAGMGRAYVAMARGPAAQYWNPAGLAFLNSSAFSFTHFSQIGDTNIEFFRISSPLNHSRVGFALAGLFSRTDDLFLLDDFGFELQELDASNTVISGSGAVRLNSGIGLGATAKWFRSNLTSYIAQGVAFDLGLFIRAAWDIVDFGFSVSNLGPGLKFLDITDPLPIIVRLGLARALLDTDAHRLEANIELTSRLVEETVVLGVGVQYLAANMLALRGGYRLGGDLGRITGGLGFSWKFFDLDYAMVPFDVLGLTHRITLTVKTMNSNENKLVAQNQVRDGQTLDLTSRSSGEPSAQKISYQYAFNLSGDLLFLSGGVDLRAEAVKGLDEIIQIIQSQYPGSRLIIASHTDDSLPRQNSLSRSNQQLSATRGEAVRKHLVFRGISNQRIQVVGYGSDYPIASNELPGGRAQNRRVQIIIHGQTDFSAEDISREAIRLMGQGSSEKAAALLERAIKVDPNNYLIHRLLGTAYLNRGEISKARESYLRALEINPQDNELKKWLDEQGEEP